MAEVDGLRFIAEGLKRFAPIQGAGRPFAGQPRSVKAHSDAGADSYADFAADLVFRLHLLRHQARVSYTLIDSGAALDERLRESVSFILAGMEAAAQELAATVAESEFAFVSQARRDADNRELAAFVGVPSPVPNSP